MVGKILQLSSQRVAELPVDFIDVAGEPETLGQLAPVISENYQQAGRRLTGQLPPKPHTQPKRNCC